MVGMVGLVLRMRLELRSLCCHLWWRYVCRLECVSAVLWNRDWGGTGARRVVSWVGRRRRGVAIGRCLLRRDRRKVAGVAHGDVSLAISRARDLHHGWATDLVYVYRNGSWFRRRRFLDKEMLC